MRKKIYLVQPTYRNPEGLLHKGGSLIYASLALPALSAAIPSDWEKAFCLEYFDEVDFDTDASVVGITSMGYDLLRGREIAAEFKRRGKTVLFGGSQAHFSASRLKEECDTVIHGHPGPAEMRALLDDVASGRVRPEYSFGLDVDYPFDFDVFDGRHIRFMPLLSSIGCRNACSFCCTYATYGGAFGLRGIPHILADVRRVRARTRYACFVDPNVYNSRLHLLTLCERMTSEGFELRWGAQCTIEIGDDQQLLEALHRAGCRFLMVGLESLNQENLAVVGKQINAARHRERIRRIQGNGIAVGGYFILGMDSDTPASFEELYTFIHTTRIAVPILNILIPAPGTPLYEKLEREGRLLVRNEEDFLRNNARYSVASSHCFYQPLQMSVEETETGFLDLYGRLSTYPRILRRSLVPDPALAATLLFMNRELRKGYHAMLRERQEVPHSSTQ
jgi:radical SAM superfamily enzyme YgiQ (UPF0313 family)